MPNLYAIFTTDRSDAGSLRMDKLQQHIQHVEQHLDRLSVAGPLRDEAGDFAGSLLVVKAEDEADARALLELDPYFQSGLWDQIEIKAFSAVAGDWVGGKTW